MKQYKRRMQVGEEPTALTASEDSVVKSPSIGTDIKIVALLRSKALKDEVLKALSVIEHTQVLAFVGNLSDLKTKKREMVSADVVLAEIDTGNDNEIAALAAFMKKSSKRTAVVAITADTSLKSVRRLMRLEIADVIPLPISQAEVLQAVSAATHKLLSARSGPKQSGQVITFINQGGGVGATTLAVQVAHAFASRRKNPAKVAILDFDLQFGKAALYLDLQPKNDWMSDIKSLERLDASLLKALMVQHESEVCVLASPNEPVSLDVITPELATRTVEVAASEFDYVIVDLPPVWTDWTTAVLLKSNILVHVTQLTVGMIRGAVRQQQYLDKEKLTMLPRVLVANRSKGRRWLASPVGEVKVKEAENALGRKIDYFVPSDFALVAKAQNQGIPLSRRHAVERRIAGFVGVLTTRMAQAPAGGQTSGAHSRIRA